MTCDVSPVAMFLQLACVEQPGPLLPLFSQCLQSPLFLPFYNLYVLCSPVRDFLLGRLVPGCKRIRTICIFNLFTLADSNCEPFPIKCSGKRKYHYSIFRISQYLLIIYGEVNTCRVLGDFPQEFWNVNTESEGENTCCSMEPIGSIILMNFKEERKLTG